MLIYTGCKHILSPLALSQLPSAIVDATHLSLDIARRDYRARSAVPLRSEPVAALLRARCNTPANTPRTSVLPIKSGFAGCDYDI